MIALLLAAALSDSAVIGSLSIARGAALWSDDRLADDAAIYLGLAAIDLYSTAYALKRNPSAAEGNPLAFDVASRDALKVGKGR